MNYTNAICLSFVEYAAHPALNIRFQLIFTLVELFFFCAGPAQTKRSSTREASLAATKKIETFCADCGKLVVLIVLMTSIVSLNKRFKKRREQISDLVYLLVWVENSN